MTPPRLFRKKPDHRVYTPQQFFRATASLINTTDGVCQCQEGSHQGHVHTIHQGQVVDLEDGDWVMPEADGEHYYPIKPDVFARTYEEITPRERA